ncbi:uncharacterized protein BT62DRAFT_1076570 [Guyanagaster necrorhizus]|uniref:Uncharacterized protein n=1 Tax=Guyanagaster necrorhizus TaxID=856835 RepID=A0A9P7VRN6_9AGAR|nr:uncharacterized protein BT62DRAFT_1076570 [Guyanagaster necrorhizus MCA 3950]KAG7446191.1 hypothetical protein BT62DRAFT_1076570 [Guyanagaster necrorhizus MCA 3950]
MFSLPARHTSMASYLRSHGAPNISQATPPLGHGSSRRDGLQYVSVFPMKSLTDSNGDRRTSVVVEPFEQVTEPVEKQTPPSSSKMSSCWRDPLHLYYIRGLGNADSVRPAVLQRLANRTSAQDPAKAPTSFATDLSLSCFPTLQRTWIRIEPWYDRDEGPGLAKYLAILHATLHLQVRGTRWVVAVRLGIHESKEVVESITETELYPKTFTSPWISSVAAS